MDNGNSIGVEDIGLCCIDCGIGFIWSAGAQRFFAERQFPQPKRCQDCAAAKRDAHNERPVSRGYRGGR